MEKNLEVLATDIDEVLLDTLRAFLVYYNPKYGTEFKREDFYTYSEWAKVLKITEKQAIDEVYEFILSPKGLDIPPISGSQNALNQLKNKYRIVAPTYRALDFRIITHVSLDQNFPGAISQVYFANLFSKNGRDMAASKLGFLKSANAKCLVEDQMPVAIECAKGGIRVYLFKSPWNETEPIPKNLDIIPVESWNELLPMLMSNANE